MNSAFVSTESASSTMAYGATPLAGQRAAERGGAKHPTVMEHVLTRLRAIGISDVFGVPGDYAFPVEDAIVNCPAVEWIGCCNELNAAYAADGYARIRGIGAVSTTYGVGELSAINGIAGACAEHLPLFHLVGMPNMATQAGRRWCTIRWATASSSCFGGWPSRWYAPPPS